MYPLPVKPSQSAANHHGGHEDEPEPDENKDLLVEEVDGEDTLHGVSVDVAELTHVEVTQRDPREAFRGGPVLLAQQSYDELPRERSRSDVVNTSCFLNIAAYLHAVDTAPTCMS